MLFFLLILCRIHIWQIGNSLFTLNFVQPPMFTWLDGVDVKDSLVITQVYDRLVQSCVDGTTHITKEEAWLVDAANPYGVDNELGTEDDGLKIAPSSLAFNAGYNAGAPNDITEMPIPFPTSVRLSLQRSKVSPAALVEMSH